MTSNTPDAEETDENSERETEIVCHIPIDVPIPTHVMEAAEQKNNERPAGVLEDYIIESISVSMRPLDA